MEKERVLHVNKTSKTYPGVKALNNMQLEIKKGEIHALVGENGAGKSTLIKVLAGVIKPDEGANIVLREKEYSELTPIESVKNGISVIFQDFSLFNNLTVAENIVFGDEVLKGTRIVNNASVKKRAGKALSEMDINIDLDAVVGSLPIAKHQMIAIARAIIQKASLIIMDEPTSTLSNAEVEKLFEIIEKLKEKGVSVLFVSHKLKELFRIADRFTVMRDGNYVGTYQKEEINDDKLISYMVGRKVELVEHVNNQHGNKILQIRNLSRKGNYKNISFTVHEGEILGITGLVGAGRTELLNTLFGLNAPDEGEIYYKGKRIEIDSPSAAKKLGIAYVPEDRHSLGLVGNKTLIQNITLPNLEAYTNGMGIIDPKKEEEKCNEQLENLQVRPKLPTMLACNLSGGNQQKIVIGKWLAASPQILMIDEPTNGIDVGAKNEIHTIIQKLSKTGVAVIMVSSDLQEVLAVSDRIIVMRRGCMVGEFMANSEQESIMQKAFLGKKEEYKDQYDLN